jgi:hypothetical protein
MMDHLLEEDEFFITDECGYCKNQFDEVLGFVSFLDDNVNFCSEKCSIMYDRELRAEEERDLMGEDVQEQS